MKREITPQSRGLLVMYRVVVAIIFAVVLAMIAGSLYALVRPPDSGPLFRIGSQQPGRQETVSAGSVNVFSGIGRLRIPLAGEPAATIILSISFPYPATDRPFTEELASRIGDFRSIANLYFSSLSHDQAVNLDEEAAKSEILKRYNAILRLGTIEALYFGDLMIVE